MPTRSNLQLVITSSIFARKVVEKLKSKDIIFRFVVKENARKQSLYKIISLFSSAQRKFGHSVEDLRWEFKNFSVWKRGKIAS